MINITYQFDFPETNDNSISYRMGLDENNFEYHCYEKELSGMAKWAALDFHQCKNCTLDIKRHPLCPIAKNLNNMVNFFKDTPSFKKTTVFVKTKDRAYVKKCSVQEGLFPIFGLIMATSGCQHMEFFKPLARFHLPFSSVEETFFRVSSTHLLKEYLKKKKNNSDTEISLDGMLECYSEVEIVNKGILDRINSISEVDANKNALIILNNFAQIIGTKLSDNLETLNKLLGI